VKGIRCDHPTQVSPCDVEVRKDLPACAFGRGAPKGQADGDPLFLQSAAQSGANPIYLLSDIEATLRTDRVARTSRFLRSPVRSYPAAFGLRGSWNARRCRAFPATLRAVTWAGWQGQPGAQPCRLDSQLRRCRLASAAERCPTTGEHPRRQGTRHACLEREAQHASPR
jgi:hypothetical protein